ncbi:MAG: tetratricopeptide repeat protein [Rhodocyclaceae bacterium]
MLCVAGLALAMGSCAAADDADYAQALRLSAAGRLDEASALLERVIAAEPAHAGAWLDLTLLHCELGRGTQARQSLERVMERFDPPPELLDLISQYQAQGCLARQPVAAPPTLLLTLQRGADSNANQGASSPWFTFYGLGVPLQIPLLPDYLPRADSFTEIAADYTQPLAPFSSATRIFGQLQLRAHDRLASYDKSIVMLGADAPWQRGAWRGALKATVSALGLGGRLYQRQLRLQGQANPPLTLPDGVRLGLTGALARMTYPTLAGFDSSQQELGALLDVQRPRWAAQINLGALADQATATRPGGDRQGWYAGVRARIGLPNGALGEFSASRQNWQGATAYSPGLIELRREQTIDMLLGAVSYPLGSHQTLRLEWRATRNHENIAVFGFDSQTWTLGWTWRGL